MIEHSAEIGKIAAALCLAQVKMHGAVKDSRNPAFKSQYASLASVMDAAKPALSESGIAFTQAPGQIYDGAIEITTMLMHGESGQWMRSTLHVPLGKRDPQGVGSAITYGQRYSLMATLGLPPVDDDGEAAVQRQEPATKADSRETYERLSAANRKLATVEAFDKFWAQPNAVAAFDSLPVDWRKKMAEERDDKIAELQERAAIADADDPFTSPPNGRAYVAPNFEGAHQ